MLKPFMFAEWAPDLAQNATDSLAALVNAVPIANGYAPQKAWGAITTALDGAFQGGAAFVGSDGTASLLAGTATKLERFSGGDWSDVLDSLTAGRWYFAQFGDNVIAANGGPLLSYDLIGGTADEIDGAPTAADVATVRDFVFVLEPDGNELAVQWCAFNNSSVWTPGTDQADIQPLLSGGKGMKVVGGETGLVLQRGAIKRFTYAGGDVIFQIDEISSEIGCMARGSVVQVGQMVYFLSERGFMVTDRNTVTPIGAEKVDRTFFGTYSRDDIENITAAVDPRRALVMWAMPGNPGLIWAYNWQLQRWTTIGMDLAGIFTGFTANVSIDALDALYPDGIDSIPVSLDDPMFAGGNPLLLIANGAGEIGTFSGENLEAGFKLPAVEPFPGQRTIVRSIRPVSDCSAAVAIIDAKARAGDPERLSMSGGLRANGEMPIRANGRYLGTTLTIPAGAEWTYVQGVELFCEAAGLR